MSEDIPAGAMMSNEENRQGSSKRVRTDFEIWSEEPTHTLEDFKKGMEYERKRLEAKKHQDDWLQHLDEMTDE